MRRDTLRRCALVLLLAAFAAVPRVSAEGGRSDAVVPVRKARSLALADMRRRFMDPGPRSEPDDGLAMDMASYAELQSLRDQVEFVRAGRVEAFDDWATYADMVVRVAQRLGVQPPESALALYRSRIRPAGDALDAAESRARSSLLAQISDPSFVKRYFYVTELVDTPQPVIAATPAPQPKSRSKKKGAKRRVARGPELAPPPKTISVIGRIDWDKTDELADVADGNAHNWDRRKGESPRKYARRLRRLRKHCYAWVRRDIAALGLWDDRLFRGAVSTRRDPKRPIRAASFALAMAKVQAAEPLIARTPIRELNLRVDPIVRGAILVFSQSVCGYDRRSGHIEIVTSVMPLRAASYKFHDVKSECLVRASRQNKVHVYVPLRPESAPVKPQNS
ncbi:MAG: hypothetical protein KGJ84_15120 [Elusimicrobia bacterium]|nr:hypothetical protein [Elusimicrobiota bacterium]